jgi:hypothetical protein
MMEGSKKQYFDTNAPFASAGLIIRQKEPKNLEAPFDLIDTYLTPTELFYIRSHLRRRTWTAPLINSALTVR